MKLRIVNQIKTETNHRKFNQNVLVNIEITVSHTMHSIIIHLACSNSGGKILINIYLFRGSGLDANNNSLARAFYLFLVSR